MNTKHTVVNPYNGDVVNSVELIDSAAMDAAIEAALTAFQQTKKIPAHKRVELLRELEKSVSDDAELFAQSIMQEAGKPITSARAEVQRAVAVLRGSAEEATRIGGEQIPIDSTAAGDGRFAVTRRFPIGPIAGISPFNFPLNLGLHKVGPALASGNTILWKPPLQAPGAALLFQDRFEKIAQRLEFPRDAMQIVICEDAVAEQLVTDPRVKLLSFTGSARVGWTLRVKAGAKKVVLELGGNAAVIVAEDADIEAAAKKCAVGGFTYTGQTCISVQRIIVHHSIYEKFRTSFLSFVKSLKVGDPADSDVSVGPMVSSREANRVATWIKEAVDNSATMLCGGKQYGLVFEPVVFENVDRSMKIVSQEIFGPVVTLQKYSDWDDALAMVNDSVYGLQAGIFTNDIRRIMSAFETIEVGGLIVNDTPTFRIDSMPYGGVKDSGLGREGMHYAIQDMTDERLLIIS